MRFLLHHIIDRAATQWPDKTAFRFDEQAITYAALAAKTNQLAHMLVDQGVRRGDRVGIFLHKSMESAIALYGIMQAGAAYVPLDPSMPASRLAFVIDNCGIRHCISEPRKLPILSAVATECELHSIIGIGENTGIGPARAIPWSAIDVMPGATPPAVPGLTEHDLAYIMYTSGSTGAPKGLMHTHHSGLSYARAAAALYDVRPQDILSNHSPLHFDMSTFDYFSGPLRGATTIIIPEEYKKLPASMSALIEEERMTIWYSVTTALVELLLRGALEQRDLSALRWVLFGGEPFPPKHLKALMEQLPHARFGNVYGPAEVNQCTYFHVPPLPNQYDESYVPIGQVWDIADWLIVDEDDQPVDPGVVGELLICAPTRMQGYWKQPELTENGFFRQQPHAGSPYERVFYRTGDLVRLGDDGQLEFHGRKDRQTKIRGHRVELDEIEAAISLHPAVAEVAVFALPDETGSRRLEAAVVLTVGAPTTPADLRQHTAARLPGYAVPSRFLIHTHFPRTGSGKIDRQTLQAKALAEAEGVPAA